MDFCLHIVFFIIIILIFILLFGILIYKHIKYNKTVGKLHAIKENNETLLYVEITDLKDLTDKKKVVFEVKSR